MAGPGPESRTEELARNAAWQRSDYERALNEELVGVQIRADAGDEHAKQRVGSIKAELKRVGGKVLGRKQVEQEVAAPPAIPPPPAVEGDHLAPAEPEPEAPAKKTAARKRTEPEAPAKKTAARKRTGGK